MQRSFLCLFGAECQLGKGFNVDRAGEEVALGNITAHIPKLIGLDASLEPSHTVVMCSSRASSRILRKMMRLLVSSSGSGQKIAVQFEFVNGQFTQDIERRVTRTKVVHGYREAQCMQSGNDRCDFFCLIGCRALGDLDDDILGVKIILGYSVRERFPDSFSGRTADETD